MSRQWLSAAVAALVLLGCGGGTREGMLEGAVPTEVVEAPAPSRPEYSTVSSDGPVLGESGARAVERGVRAAAEARGIEMEGDGRLGLLAAWTAERLGEGGTPPPQEVVEFFARHLGLVEPVPHLLILGHSDASQLEQGIQDSVSQFLARQPYNRFGAAVVPRQGITLAVVTLSERWVELTPLNRRFAAGSTISLRGRLLGEFLNPTIAIADPDGTVARHPAGDGPEFTIDVPTGDAGTYRIEVLAQGPRGDTVIANFPVYVGVDVPERVELRLETEGGDQNASSVADRLFRLLNSSREQAGLGPVERHGRLREIAMAHSRDMVDNGFVGHESPTTGSASMRVRAAGVQSGLVLENIGRGYSAQEIHQGLLASPGHRQNILNADATHVGIGVVAEPEGNRTAFVATEVFVRMARRIDVSEAPEDLLEMINRARSARRAGTLEAEPNLTEAAQNAAEAFFEDHSLEEQDVVDDASASLRRFAIAFRRVGGLMAVVTDVSEAAQLEPTFDPDARYIGIGVAQGNRPGAPRDAIAIVIMLAWPR